MRMFSDGIAEMLTWPVNLTLIYVGGASFLVIWLMQKFKIPVPVNQSNEQLQANIDFWLLDF